ncbi:hypothetical protein CHS0354_006984 [Potamilus streckersoni]|uniref:BAG family molecular chaperone regulator 2 n=1 Tax=Potamilus streckersoni TaxID=2493646 RepID=A0AAE0RWI3_9BIVA|nr:hypothetical protein CHS0354_006984 [Potamilus streckersoni]
MAEDSAIISERESEAHRTLRCLDEIGKRVTVLREQALTLMREKEDMLSLLQDLQDNKSVVCSKAERDEIQAITEMLVCRCLTVEISVTTPRDENQEIALSKVQNILEDLDSMFKTDVEYAKQTAESYLNACLPEPRGNSTDHKFQGLVLGCAADDQKAVRKRLETLLAHLKYM